MLCQVLLGLLGGSFHHSPTRVHSRGDSVQLPYTQQSDSLCWLAVTRPCWRELRCWRSSSAGCYFIQQGWCFPRWRDILHTLYTDRDAPTLTHSVVLVLKARAEVYDELICLVNYYQGTDHGESKISSRMVIDIKKYGWCRPMQYVYICNCRPLYMNNGSSPCFGNEEI